MSAENLWWWIGVALVVILAMKFGRLMVKAIVVIGLVIAVVLIAPAAFGAETKPWTACGSTVTFAAPQSHGAPDGVAAAVAAAYADVGPSAGLTVMVESGGNPGTATTAWAWSDPLAGISYPDADTSDKNSITEITARVHQHAASAPASGPALKSLLLRDIGRDLGVPLAAPGGKLSKADRTLLKAACKAQALTPSASSTPTPAASDATVAPDGTQALTTPATATPPVHPVTITAQEKVIGYGGAGIAAVVLALTLAGSRIRTLATKAGHTLPTWSSIRDRVNRLRKRPSKAKASSAGAIR